MGFTVLGFDTDAGKVERLNRGESYIRHISSSRLADLLKPREGTGQFAATHDMGRLGEPDVLIYLRAYASDRDAGAGPALCSEHHPRDCRLPASPATDFLRVHHLPWNHRGIAFAHLRFSIPGGGGFLPGLLSGTGSRGTPSFR